MDTAQPLPLLHVLPAVIVARVTAAVTVALTIPQPAVLATAAHAAAAVAAVAKAQNLAGHDQDRLFSTRLSRCNR